MNHVSLVWANDAQGIARHIMEVPSGLDCQCFCPGCNARLEAVNSRNANWKKRPHFRHYQAPELESCAVSSVLAAARQVSLGITEIKLPSFESTQTVTSASGQVFTGHAREPEHVIKVTAAEFVDSTDAILTLINGQKIRIRLVATTKRQLEPSQLILNEIVISLADAALRNADPEVLRQHISLSASARTWCHFINANAIDKKALDSANQKMAVFDQKRLSARPPRLLEPRPEYISPIEVNSLSRFSHSERPRAVSGRQTKPIKCDWCSARPNPSQWTILIPTWKAIFDSYYQPLLELGMKARDEGQDANESLRKAAKLFPLSPQAILSLWSAAQIAHRL